MVRLELGVVCSTLRKQVELSTLLLLARNKKVVCEYWQFQFEASGTETRPRLVVVVVASTVVLT